LGIISVDAIYERSNINKIFRILLGIGKQKLGEEWESTLLIYGLKWREMLYMILT